MIEFLFFVTYLVFGLLIASINHMIVLRDTFKNLEGSQRADVEKSFEEGVTEGFAFLHHYTHFETRSNVELSYIIFILFWPFALPLYILYKTIAALCKTITKKTFIKKSITKIMIGEKE